MLPILFCAFLLLLVIGFDVGFSMLASALLGINVASSRAVDGTMIPISMIAGVDAYALVQIPLFVLAGELMNRGGLTLRLIDWAEAMVGRVKGAMGHVAILTNFVLAGVSGSAVADAVAIGKPLIPSMQRRGYSDGYAGAVVAAGALLGPIIPPSIPMVVYAQIASQSVVKLFMAGVLPGVVLAAGFLVVCTIMARRRQYPPGQRVAFRAKLTHTSRASWALAMPLIILGGIRFGIFTDTEAAAVAATYACLVGLLVYRDLKFGEIPGVLKEVARSSGTILFLLAAAGPFSWLVAESQIGMQIVGLIGGVTTNPLLILLTINVLLLVVGSIIEPLPAMIIFVPTLLPLGHQFGIDPIQFGAVIVINLMIGMLHPPIGLLLFVTASVGKVPIAKVMVESLPFLAWALVVLVIAIVWPPLTTWLPNQMHG